MHTLLIAALSSLAFAASASTAFAEDRAVNGGYVGDGREAGEERLASDAAGGDEAEDIVARAEAGSGSGDCDGAVPTSSGGCVESRPYSLTRRVDWSSVGPSAEDFAPSDEGLRLRGARLVGTFRF